MKETAAFYRYVCFLHIRNGFSLFKVFQASQILSFSYTILFLIEE